jgi:hypothetical protein
MKGSVVRHHPSRAVAGIAAETDDRRQLHFRDERNLKEIAVSDRETLRGLTHFCELWSSHVRKPFNANEFEERVQSTPTCAIISARPIASC